MVIRRETSSDVAAINAVHSETFGLCGSI